MSTFASPRHRATLRILIGGATAGLLAASLTVVPAAQAAATDFVGSPAAMGSGANEVVWAIAANSTTALAAGGFTSIGGVAATRIAQYDLATNTWSTAGTFGVAPEVLATYSNGDIVAGGTFASADGAANSANIAYWHAGVWSGMGDANQVLDGGVFAIDFADDGTMYVGGQFAMSSGGTGLNYVAKWSGTSWLPLGTGLNARVRSVAVDSQDNVYVAGDFTTAGGSAAAGIAMWNGSTWQPLGSGLGTLDSPNVDIAIDGNDDLYVVGDFSTVGGISANKAAKWDGSTWTALAGGLSFGIPFNLAVDSADQVYVAGSFVTAKDSSNNSVPNTVSLARWSGTEWQGMSPTLNGGSASAVSIGGPYGEVFLGGSFNSTTPATSALNYVARMQPGPTISAVTPSRVGIAGGTSFTVSGAALKGATVAITVDGVVPDNVAPVSESTLTAETKAHAAGEVTLSLTTPAGTDTATMTYVGSPVITGVSPDVGPAAGNNTVTIDGVALTDVTAVQIGGIAATGLTVVNDQQITVVAPANVVGAADVKVITAFGEVTQADGYAYATAPGTPWGLRQTSKVKDGLTLAWDPPAATGGAEVTSYAVSYRKHGGSTWRSYGSVSATSVRITGLRTGTEYDVRVGAVNAIGMGSYASLTLRTPSLPAAPTRVSAKVRGSVVTLKWTKAVVQTGSTRTANVIKCTKGSTSKKVRLAAGATSGSITLGKGTWTCKVYAYTEAGHGPGSTAKVVIVG